MNEKEPGCVLVVDDEPDMLDAITLLLEACGYRVLAARHGGEALEILRKTRPCIILLDLMMPVMDGWQFREAQLRDASLADVPVVVITGAGIVGDAPAAFATAAGFLQKPVDTEGLLRIISKHCQPSPAVGSAERL